VRIRMVLAGLTAGALAAVGAAVPAQANQNEDATVSIVHAVPNTPVDVYVNHHRLLNDFQPGTIAGPLQLPSGGYTVTITAATAKNDRHPVIGPVKLRFAERANYSVVAHLTAAGTPTASLYRNSTAPTKGEYGRVIVRHDAAAPAVDVLANGARVIAGLTNPGSRSLQVPEGRYRASVTLAGTRTTVIGPATLQVPDNADTIVYAYGSAKDKTLGVIVQTIRTARGE
jgi:hypothetical protein